MMYYIYSMTETDYVSLKQNLLILEIQQNICSNEFDRTELRLSKSTYNNQQNNNPIISEGMFIELVDHLMKRQTKHKLLIFDARNIDFKLMKDLTSFKKLIEDKYDGIAFVADEGLAKFFSQRLSPPKMEWVQDNEVKSECLLYSRLDNYQQVFSSLPFDNLNAYISGELRKLVFSYLREDETEPKSVLSSNVYANRYFNVRKLFRESNLYQLSIFLLIQHLIQYEGEFDAFVCSSVNGACIASSLSIYFRKPVVFLRNVGPQMTARDSMLTKRIMEGRRYVYVFDFMCLGTEYQRIKMLCNIRNAKIVLGLGISKYKELNDKILAQGMKRAAIVTLFDINEFEANYYKCFVEEKECVDYINTPVDERKES